MFSGLKIHLIGFQEAERYVLSIFEYLAFSIGFYGSLFSVVHPVDIS